MFVIVRCVGPGAQRALTFNEALGVGQETGVVARGPPTMFFWPSVRCPALVLASAPIPSAFISGRLW